MKNRREFLKSAASASVAALPMTSWGQSFDQFTFDAIPDHSAFTNEKEYWKAIRLQFLLKEGQTYFNNGTIGPMPGYVMNKVIDHMRYYAVHGAEIDYKGNGEKLLSGYFKYESLRKKIGGLVNAEMQEIALTQNATHGMNFVANGLELKKGDEIINTDQE
ncbi:MAG: aminotransferase class V-fold PLP-dependent enzyme, partial [Cyclobacteriaceae bacterium]